MANQEQLDILEQGVDVWNKWRKQHKEVQPELSRANLQGAHLQGVDLGNAYLSQAHLNGAHLEGAHLQEANLSEAELSRANLQGAHLYKANLYYAHLEEAHLEGANLREAYLSRANLYKAMLQGANLTETTLVRTILTEADLTHCSIYGISAWSVDLEGARQDDLVITLPNEPIITVDNLKVAQFIYLLLTNKEIRDVFDTITSKVVLILGRFTDERKNILNALRDALRKYDYTPVLFDFDKPASRGITETVSTLAHMARFVIADITDAKSIPQELMTIVPNLPSLAVQPLILNSQHEYGMFEHFTRYPWVLPLYRYTDQASLLKSLKIDIIEPAEQKAKELEKR